MSNILESFDDSDLSGSEDGYEEYLSEDVVEIYNSLLNQEADFIEGVSGTTSKPKEESTESDDEINDNYSAGEYSWRWRKKIFEPPQEDFHGYNADDATHIKLPVDYFFEYFPYSLLNIIVYQTNRSYMSEKGTELKFCLSELKKTDWCGDNNGHYRISKNKNVLEQSHDYSP